jgi:hypothetical protein
MQPRRHCKYNNLAYIFWPFNPNVICFKCPLQHLSGQCFHFVHKALHLTGRGRPVWPMKTVINSLVSVFTERYIWGFQGFPSGHTTWIFTAVFSKPWKAVHLAQPRLFFSITSLWQGFPYHRFSEPNRIHSSIISRKKSFLGAFLKLRKVTSSCVCPSVYPRRTTQSIRKDFHEIWC